VSSLFLDTSYDQILGLLHEKKSWIDFKTFEGQKLTGVIHSDLNAIFKKNTTDPLKLDSVYYCAGPGFYTGLRVAYGIADILRLHGIPVLSFYSHLVPHYCGNKNYIWITKAYRGEIFVYDSVTNKISLHLEKNFSPHYEGRDVFTHSPTSVDESLRILFPEMKFSQHLILNNPQMIFSSVNEEQELYYFRPLDEEYKPSL